MVVDKDLQSIAVTNKFGSAYRFWGKCAGRFFRPAPALGYGLVVSVCFALYECFWCPYLRFTLFGAYYCHCGVKIEIWGFLRLLSIVPIRTVLGTGAVLLDSIVAVASETNFTCVFLGTGYIF